VETEAGRLVDGWASRTAQSMQLDPGTAACGYCARDASLVGLECDGHAIHFAGR
jgi:hypothetical protein